MDQAERIRRLLRQQAAIASFGSFALRQYDLMSVLNEAARVCAGSLGARFSKVCRYRPVENDLLIEAGFGWQEGVIGNVVSRADASSPQGRAFSTRQPSICYDLQSGEFELPAFYAEHGIVSTIDVIIKGKANEKPYGVGNDKPYGVLEIDSDEHHQYDQHDIDFLTGFANILAEAVATSARTAILRSTIEQMKELVVEKDRALEQKNVLAEELQHRVRNNLQLVYGMLNQQLFETVDQTGKQGIAGIARRVFTLAQVYDHLGGAEMTRTTDFGKYVKSLCTDLADLHAAPNGTTLVCDSDTLILDLDVATALGIITTELVTNSFDHAFPAGNGEISVAVRAPTLEHASATIVISDSGVGFKANGESKRHGLGLVRRLIEQLGAKAVIDSNSGTAWTIDLPVESPAPS